MSVGIFVKAINASYKKDNVELFFEFIPQILLLWVLFGWMDCLIIIKWLTDYKTASVAPAIIPTMINNFLNLADQKSIGSIYVFDEGLQKGISQACLVIAFICVPVMLCCKPCLMARNMKHHHREIHTEKNVDQMEEEKLMKTGEDSSVNVEKEIADCLDAERGEDGDHAMSEVWIHQLIETIEFALGTVSNTASYLRLWALSLAHSQLAEVFYKQTYEGAMSGAKDGKWITSMFMFTITFTIFASATIFILMLMDVMECFLHTLRLHWVEFQNKFYKGAGYKFTPYSFQRVLEEEMAK
jgi:V-type H+-transporting ATPase subunit a